MQQKPSAGRIVHYVLPEESPRKGHHRAAIISSNWGGKTQNLNVQLDQCDDHSFECIQRGFYKVGDFAGRVWGAVYDESGKPGTWHFPERTFGEMPVP